MTEPNDRKAFKDALSDLGKDRSSKVIVYMTGDRNPPNLFPTQIGTDILDLLYSHLAKMGKQKKISLLIYTSGGHLNAPWPIVSMIREFTPELEVIVPIKALSAGTLICLGADKIVMTPRSFISPIDPTGSFQIEGGKQLNIAIEDIMGYLKFVKEKFGIKREALLIEPLKELTSKVPPTILGSIERTHAYIRKIAKNMLRFSKLNEKKIDKIVEHLIEKCYFHNHLINRREAETDVGLGNMIEYADGDKEKAIMKCFDMYLKELELGVAFDPLKILNGQMSITYTPVRAIIETENLVNRFESDIIIKKNEKEEIQLTPTFQGWR